MAKSAMPKSKAKTAYGLLSEIRKLIIEEPKRYDQTAWKRDPRERTPDNAPACGTTCCVAGWVDTLKSTRPIPASNAHLHESLFVRRGRNILGISDEQADELFDGNAAGEPYRYMGWTRQYRFREHARRGAAHIARFQKKYAAQLKAKRV